MGNRILTFLVFAVVIGIIFLLFGGLFALVLKLWFIWLPILVIVLLFSVLSRIFRRARPEPGQRGDSGEGKVIETEYRVEEEDEPRKKP